MQGVQGEQFQQAETNVLKSTIVPNTRDTTGPIIVCESSPVIKKEVSKDQRPFVSRAQNLELHKFKKKPSKEKLSNLIKLAA